MQKACGPGKNSYLEFESSILIYFNRNYGNIEYFHLLLQYYDNENKSLESLKMLMASGTVTKFCNITNSCIIRIPNDFEKIYFKLSIKLNDGQNRSDFISILHFENIFILNVLKNNLVYNVNSFNKIKKTKIENIFSKIIQYFQRIYKYLTKYYHLNR